MIDLLHLQFDNSSYMYHTSGMEDLASVPWRGIFDMEEITYEDSSKDDQERRVFNF